MRTFKHKGKSKGWLLLGPVMLVAVWAMMLQTRPKTPVLVLQQLEVFALPNYIRTLGDRPRQTRVAMVVRFNNPRPFWEREGQTWGCEVGYVWWTDQKGKRHESDNQSVGSVKPIDRNRMRVFYDFSSPVFPATATQAFLKAKLNVNGHFLPIKIVTHRRVNGKMQIVKYPPIRE